MISFVSNLNRWRRAMKISFVAFTLFATLSISLHANSGKKVFETYCWGCHHQTAEAFGPSFAEIAQKRSSDEIRAMITDPASVSKLFGYSRNAMPALKLTKEELDSITTYILSFKSNTNEN